MSELGFSTIFQLALKQQYLYKLISHEWTKTCSLKENVLVDRQQLRP